VRLSSVPAGAENGARRARARRTEGLLAVRQDLADQAELERLGRVEAARRVRELAQQAVVADDLGQPLQRADVGRKAHVHLLRQRCTPPLHTRPCGR